MSELERLRKEYDAAVKRRHGKIGATGLEIRADALIAALEQELTIAKRLNSKWMDEKTAAVMRTVEADPHRSTTDSEMQKPPEGGFASPGRSPRRVQQGHYSQIAPCESIRRPSASATNCCRK